MPRALSVALVALLAAACAPSREVPQRAEAAALPDGTVDAAPEPPAREGVPVAHGVAAPPPAAETPPAPRPAWTEEAVLRRHSHALPEGAPSVVVHAPEGFRPELPLQLVVFLHGWHGCARVLALGGPQACVDGGPTEEGWDLAGRHDEARTDSLFVVPQLGFDVRSGRPGRLATDGFFRGFLEELLGESLAGRLGGPRGLDAVESVTLVAHSAGFEAATAILRRGRVDDLVRSVALMDALYAGPAVFAGWVSGGPESPARRLVSLYAGRGRTFFGSQSMAAHAAVLLGEAEVAVDPEGPLPAAVASHRVVVARSRAPHADVPARHLAELLPALGLRLRDGAVAAPAQVVSGPVR